MNPPLIFHTSVWIDVLRKRNTPQTDLLKHYLANEFETPIVPTILQELLQGIKEDGQYRKMKDVLRRFTRLEMNSMDAAMGAGTLFRALRKKDIIIRDSNNCVIAFYAMSFDLEIVYNESDNDLVLISAHTNLKTWKNNKG
jgi:predicted nucleic acid-binding protein